MKLNLKFFFFLAFSVFCYGFVGAQSLDYFGNQNFARAQNYNEIAVAKNGDVFVAYDDNTCGWRGLSVKKKSFESEVWEQVGNVCLTENTTSLISLAVDPKTGNPWVIAKDSMANTKIKLFAFDGNQWQSISTDGLVQNSVDSLDLHFTLNGDLYISQAVDGNSYIKKYDEGHFVDVGSFVSYYVRLDSDINNNLVVVVVYSDKIKVVRYENANWQQLGADFINQESVIGPEVDIEILGTDVYVIHRNNNRRLIVMKYNGNQRSRVGQYAAENVLSTKTDGVGFVVTEDTNIYVSYTSILDNSLNLVKYNGGWDNIFESDIFAPIHSDLASIQNAVLMAYGDDTASQYGSYTNVMKYGDFVVEDNLPDLIIEDLDLAYGYGATYSNYPYYSGSDGVSYVQKDEKVLVFDAKIKNMSSVESNRTFATCQAYGIYNILTYPLYGPTPIIGSFDSVNQLIRFNEFEGSMLTSTLGTKNLSCMVDQDELIEEGNENNNTFDFSFEVVNNTCEFYADACEAGSMDCPGQCVYAQFYDDYEGIKPKYHYCPNKITRKVDFELVSILTNVKYF